MMKYVAAPVDLAIVKEIGVILGIATPPEGTPPDQVAEWVAYWQDAAEHAKSLSPEEVAYLKAGGWWPLATAENVRTIPRPVAGIKSESLAGIIGIRTFEIRGRATETLIAYAIWARSHLIGLGADTREGLDLIPNVKEMLERHLDPEREPSLAVREWYGIYFCWLVDVDQDWAAGMARRIFPEADPDRWKAAWKGYVRSGVAFEPAFALLTDDYARAMDQLEADQKSGSRDYTAEDWLGAQLLHFYWTGQLGLEPGGVLARFMAAAALRLLNASALVILKITT